MTIHNRSLDLWIDGNNSTNTTWTNLAPAEFSLQGSRHTPAVRNSRFNFHRELNFNDRNSKLVTTRNYPIQSGRAYHAFVVAERGASGERTLIAFNPGTSPANARRKSLQWNSNDIRLRWNASSHLLAPANTRTYGIVAMNVMNANAAGGGTNASQLFMSGRGGNNFSVSSQSVSNRLIIGSGNSNTASAAAAGDNHNFAGSMQEVIVMSGAVPLTADEISRINSYLAIKYGLTLENSPNFVNSAGTAVWNSTTNLGFNNHVFGIARDDATLLNQVQSRHSGSNMLTLFLGDRIEVLNSNNTATFDTDKTYLMVGSNNQSVSATVSYMHAGADFVNTANDADFRFNFRTQLVYRAQLTGELSQTVNMQINAIQPNYVLVSQNPNFPPGETRIFPITNRIAMDVVIYNGDYISFGGFETRPGGVTGHALAIWIDGNNSTNDSWNNLSAATHTLDRTGSMVAPTVRNSRFNFHQELHFATAASKLRSTEGFSFALNQSYQVFVVSEQPSSGDQVLLAFSTATNSTAPTTRSLRWRNSATNAISASWTTSDRASNLPAVAGARFGIASLNVNNAHNSANNQMFLNGRASTFNLGGTVNTTGATNTANTRIMLGNGNNDTGTGNQQGFIGSIQEVIVMRGNGLMSASDIQRIHSYLAIKYGITLNAGSNATADNYLASDGTVVRDRADNAGFNNHIFGIGRDDISGLFQRQARSSNAGQHFTIFLGNELAVLNSQNTGTLGDMQFLTIGSDGGVAVQQLLGFDHTAYGLDQSTIINIRSATYKAQLTGRNEIDLRANAIRDFTHVLVSSDADFTPANTNVYEVNADGIFELTVSNTHRYIRFIGMAPGPGGITAGLAMWLRADDAISLNIEYVLPTTTGTGGVEGLPAQYIRGRTAIPTVTRWSDLARGHTYQYMPTGHTASVITAMRRPVYEGSHPEMNFQPSVRFWNQTSPNRNVFLSNTSGVISHSNGSPEHTAMLVTSNNFGAEGRSNMLMFAGATVTLANGAFNAPAFQVQRLPAPPFTGGEGSARYRWRGGSNEAAGDAGATFRHVEMFRVGATSLASFYIRPTGTTNNQIRTRFNALQQDDGWPAGTAHTIDFRRGSILGSANVGAQNPASLSMNGLISEVIIFDRVLEKHEITRLETYLAIKYGLTLRPNRFHGAEDDIFNAGIDHPTGRFNYTLSDGTIIWEGNTDENTLFARFYNNIAGVVRDDVARLNLRQSHSTDVNSIMYMGKAGTKLTDCGSYLNFLENNLEAIIWGATNFGSDTEMRAGNDNGVIRMNDGDCGDFAYIFSRIWYVRKHSPTGRPLEMLVSPRNNSNLTFGQTTVTDVHTQHYYNLLNGGNDFVMLVADTYQDMIAKNFSAVIPMNWIEGQHQARYIFTREGTFVTFGYQMNGRGCLAASPADEFTGLKRFDWTQWNAGANNLGAQEVSDIVTVTGVTVTYQGGAMSVSGFPRMVNSPEAGSLEVRRRGGQLAANNVVTTVNFNVPVTPEFVISGLDARDGFLEEVEIIGRCMISGTEATFRPVLSYMTAPSEARFTINGSVATVNRRGSVSASDRSGMVHVAFQGGVTQVEIRFRSVGIRSTAEQGIFISPMTLRSVSPPPLVNENGMSFEKEVRDAHTTTCDLVEYSFFIRNTNCRDILVSLRDTLPEGLVWRAIALDNLNAERMEMDHIEINDFAGERILAIDSLLVPITSNIRVRATAEFLSNATGDIYYRNRAFIAYYIRGEEDRLGQMPSFSRETQDNYVSFYAELAEPPVREIIKEVTANTATFRENGMIEFTVVITNPGETAVQQSFLDFAFNERFTLVAGSVQVIFDESALAHTVQLAAPDGGIPPPFFSITGFGGNTGLPSGETTITFTLQAPALEHLAVEYINGQPTNRRLPLELIHSFSSTYVNDPCLSAAIRDADGVVVIPYSVITHIITNRHVTPAVEM